MKLEKWDKAIDDCKEVLSYEPENIKALLRRANAYFKKRSYQAAKNDIDICLRLNPSDKKAQVCFAYTIYQDLCSLALAIV